MDMTTLIFAAIAVFLFFKLRSALGTKTGEEKPYTQAPTNQPSNENNVLPFPTKDVPPFKWQGFADEGSDKAKAFDAIAEIAPTFTPKAFLDGAKTAYEMFITAFHKDDEAALKPHLSAEVFADFHAAINARKAANERVDFRFVGIHKADIADVTANGQEALITINFVADVITATYDPQNKVVDGSPDKITQTHDSWVFAKDLNDKNPNWVLVGTDEQA